MAVHVQHWDAFTHQPGKGNPAGIVVSAVGLADSDMQAIAARIGFNDTAFVLPSQRADFQNTKQKIWVGQVGRTERMAKSPIK